jgi:phosphonate transport system substrate-binding protein
MKRRTFMALALAWAGTAATEEAAPTTALRIGLTPVFLDDQAGFLDRWRSYLEMHLLRPIEFVQRGSYREIVDLARQGKLDLAWICGYPYVRNRPFLRIIIP